jgi:glycosyltransferase involved in cell wall biosynthesis
MRIMIVHPVMAFQGGGERLCCETIHTLQSLGHQVTLLCETFEPSRIEAFFGFKGLFENTTLALYPAMNNMGKLGTAAHLIHHLRGQSRILKKIGSTHNPPFDLIFSTQDAGYIPDASLPVIQWGYFPRVFPKPLECHSPRLLASAFRWLPLRFHYAHKISRIGLVLAISQYSKSYLDYEWKRPSVIVYPPCNMVSRREKRSLVVTVARALPVKRLELFWKVARLRPEYEFLMILTRDASYLEYYASLSRDSPRNGRTIFNPEKETYHRLLGEAKVYLHLMEGEHFGISIVEAMSAWCVPVVHDSGGPKEIVAESGFLWKRLEDVPDMIDEAMRGSPSAIARSRAEDFSVSKFETRLSSVFSRLQA